MLCCVGLFGGLYVGSTLGGPWTFIAPAAGFGLGLVGDMRLMHGKPHDHEVPRASGSGTGDSHDAFDKHKME